MLTRKLSRSTIWKRIYPGLGIIFIIWQLAGKRLANVKFDEIYASDLNRTKETAQTIVGESKKNSTNEIKYIKELREKNNGVYDGCAWGLLEEHAKVF